MSHEARLPVDKEGRETTTAISEVRGARCAPLSEIRGAIRRRRTPGPLVAPRARRRDMWRVQRAAPPLLLHVSLLLSVVGGAGLATAARLKWDPSTYVPLRELFPAEYRAASVALAAGSAALLALAHLAALALALPPAAHAARRALLYTHSGATMALVGAQVGWAWWTGARVAAWLRGAEAHHLAQVLQLRDHLQPLLRLLADWHPLPARVHQLLQEAEADAPVNVRVGCAVLVVAAVLQPTAALLALLSATRPRPRPRPLPTTPPNAHSHISYTCIEHEEAPLRTTFKNGKLVVV